MFLARLIALGTDRVLIVDHAAIPNRAGLVDEEGDGRRLGVELLGQVLVMVLEHGERDAEFFRLRGDRVELVLRVGVDADEVYAALLQLVALFPLL